MKLSYRKLIGVYAPIVAVAGATLLGGTVSFGYAESTEIRPPLAVQTNSVEDAEAGLSAFLDESKYYPAILELGSREFLVAETPDEVKTEEPEISAEVEEAAEETSAEAEEAAEETSAETEEAVEETPEEAVQDEWAARVLPKVEESANIRSEANQDSELLGRFPKGAMGQVVEQGEEWTKISSGSVTGYVKNEYLAFGEEAKQLAIETCPLMATVQIDSLRIRKEGSKEAGILTLAEAGDSYCVLEQGTDWIKIAYKDDKEGYVSADYVSVELQVGKAISIEEEREAARKAEEAKRKKEEEEAAARAKSVAVETVYGEATYASVDEVTLLAAVVQMEAGGQGYEGMLAVASVVMNRVNSGRYPNTITGVIYQRGQFPGAHNGILNRILSRGPRQDCIQIAQEALAGKNNAPGYLGFCSTSSSTYKKYSTYTLIGAHYFY